MFCKKLCVASVASVASVAYVASVTEKLLFFAKIKAKIAVVTQATQATLATEEITIHTNYLTVNYLKVIKPKVSISEHLEEKQRYNAN